MRDERLHSLFRRRKVRFRRPAEEKDAWFNILMVHQNRNNRGRGPSRCLSEDMLPDFLVCCQRIDHRRYVEPRFPMNVWFRIIQGHLDRRIW